MRSKGDISNKSGCAQQPFSSFSPSFSPPAAFLRRMFIRQCTQTREEKDRIQLYHLPPYRYPSSIQAIVLKNRARRFAYNNVHCISEQWRDPPSSSPFPPSLPPYRCFFQRQDQASRALINGGKRQTIVEFRSVIKRFISARWIQLSIILYSFFSFFSLDTRFTLFIIRRSTRTSIHFNVNGISFHLFSFLSFPFLFSRNDALLPSIAFSRGSRCIIPDPLLCLIN